MFCINCRSINSNWDALNELIYNMSSEHFHFDIIALTEVFKLRDGFNYDINGYHEILSNTRDTLDDGHGGVGIYVNKNMPYLTRDDLSVFILHVLESLFIEIQINAKKYRNWCHLPNTPLADTDLFVDKLSKITSKISAENKDVYIMGDVNIDLLKYGTHHKTNDFINSMITKGYLPLITKPTRITNHSATLIDHIYSNTTSQNYTSGIIISDLADHFGTFYTSTKSTPTDLPKYKSVRVMKQTNITYFAELLSATDFASVLSHECPNDAYNTLCNIYTHLFDAAFPIKIIRLASTQVDISNSNVRIGSLKESVALQLPNQNL